MIVDILNKRRNTGVYVVTIFTNETNIKKKINWNRINQDWDILDFKQQNHTIRYLYKRSFKIYLSKKRKLNGGIQS